MSRCHHGGGGCAETTRNYSKSHHAPLHPDRLWLIQMPLCHLLCNGSVAYARLATTSSRTHPGFHLEEQEQAPRSAWKGHGRLQVQRNEPFQA